MGTMATLVAGFTHYRGFKLVTSTFPLSILNVDLYNHIPQALHLDCSFWEPELVANYAMLMRPKKAETAIHSLLLLIFCGNLSMFVSYAMLMRPKKVETASHGC